MTRIREFVTKHYFWIICLLAEALILAIAYIIAPIYVAVIICTQLLFWSIVMSRQVTAENNKQYLIDYYSRLYFEASRLMFSVLTTFSNLGFNPVSEAALCYPSDYMHINKQGVVVFRYRCMVTKEIDLSLEKIRRLINESIEIDPFYQGLYILRIRQCDGRVELVVTYRVNENTEQYVKEHERKLFANSQEKAVDTRDKDF